MTERNKVKITTVDEHRSWKTRDDPLTKEQENDLELRIQRKIDEHDRSERERVAKETREANERRAKSNNLRPVPGYATYGSYPDPITPFKPLRHLSIVRAYDLPPLPPTESELKNEEWHDRIRFPKHGWTIDDCNCNRGCYCRDITPDWINEEPWKNYKEGSKTWNRLKN